MIWLLLAGIATVGTLALLGIGGGNYVGRPSRLGPPSGPPPGRMRPPPGGTGASRGSTRRPTTPPPRNPPPPKPGVRVRHISQEQRMLDDIASVAAGGRCTCSGFVRDDGGMMECVACGRLTSPVVINIAGPIGSADAQATADAVLQAMESSNQPPKWHPWPPGRGIL